MQDDYRFAVTSLARVPRAPSRPTGCPRGAASCAPGARANVLMGVASNRVDVHQARGRAPSAALERCAEPLTRAAAPAGRLPRTRCSTSAWRKLVLNSAHDSSCACSADEVVEAVRVRYQEARHIGEALARDALRTLAADGRRAAGVDRRREPHRAATAAAWSRVPLPGDGPVHLVALDDGTPCPTQVVRTTTPARASRPWSSARRSGGCSR